MNNIKIIVKEEFRVLNAGREFSPDCNGAGGVGAERQWSGQRNRGKPAGTKKDRAASVAPEHKSLFKASFLLRTLLCGFRLCLVLQRAQNTAPAQPDCRNYLFRSSGNNVCLH